MPWYVIIDLIHYYKQPIRHMGQFRAADLGEEGRGVEWKDVHPSKIMLTKHY